MKRVTGIGGVFFKCKDPKKMAAWYERHLVMGNLSISLMQKETRCSCGKRQTDFFAAVNI